MGADDACGCLPGTHLVRCNRFHGGALVEASVGGSVDPRGASSWSLNEAATSPFSPELTSPNMGCVADHRARTPPPPLRRWSRLVTTQPIVVVKAIGLLKLKPIACSLQRPGTTAPFSCSVCSRQSSCSSSLLGETTCHATLLHASRAAWPHRRLPPVQRPLPTAARLPTAYRPG